MIRRLFPGVDRIKRGVSLSGAVLALAAALLLTLAACAADARSGPPAAPSPAPTATLAPTFPPVPTPTAPPRKQLTPAPTVPPERVLSPLSVPEAGRCQGRECLSGSSAGLDYPTGIVALEGFLSERESMDLEQQPVVCPAFVVLDGSSDFMAALRRSALIPRDSLGRPVINLAWEGLSADIQQALSASGPAQPVEIMALVLPAGRRSLTACSSPIEVARINRPYPIPTQPGAGAELEVREYRLDQPPAADGFAYARVWEELGDRLETSASQRNIMVQRMIANNLALRPFDLRLRLVRDDPEQETYFRLYRGALLLRDRITTIGPVSLRPGDPDRGDPGDFAMLVDSELVRRDSIERWDSRSGLSPYFVGQHLMWVDVTDDPGTLSRVDLVHVMRDGAVIYTHPVQEPDLTRPELVGFWGYDSHWALETIDSVVIDGQPVNAQYGYEASFGFQVLRGKPFYFFSRGGRIGVVYDGREVALNYNEVPHETCCGLTALSPRSTDRLVWFFARRGDEWFYVEIDV